MSDDIRSIMTGIRSDLSNLMKSFDEFKKDQREIVDKLDVRLGAMEVAQARSNERISNMAIFQGAFSVIIGAVATYLGVQKQ